MDADSTIAPEFLEVALGLLEDDPDLIAVGGLFYGEDGGGLVGQFQRNEYTRYQRVVARKLGPGVRADRDRVGDPRVRAARGGRGPRSADPRARREGLRHPGADRGQRAHAGAEDPGRQDDLAAAVPR